MRGVLDKWSPPQSPNASNDDDESETRKRRSTATTSSSSRREYKSLSALPFSTDPINDKPCRFLLRSESTISIKDID